MSIAPTDAPEDASSSDFAPANPELAESPPTDSVTPPSPEDLARDNARNGRWAMNEYFDGCVLLGADDKPVMRNDGSRVGFFFRDAQHLADELAAGSAPSAVPSENDADSRAAVWWAHRRALAPLDSGFNKDWDPQRPKSTLADMTKWTRLLAYHYVQTTEPEEAVRHAVSDIFGKPLNGPRMRLWVPGKHNADMVKAAAEGLMRQAVGEQATEREDIDNAWRWKGTKLRHGRESGLTAGSKEPTQPSDAERKEIENAMRRKGETLRHGREIGGGSALTEAPQQIVGGIRDGLQEAWEALDDAASDLNKWMPLTLIETDRPLSETFVLPEVAKPKTASGAAVRVVSQFVVGFLPALKAARGLKVAALGGHQLEQATASSLASAAVLDPLEARVSNLIEEFPAFRNPITEYLAAQPGDSKAEGRLKNAIEGFALGIWGEGLLRALNVMHAWQHFKEEHAHDGGHQPISDESQPDSQVD
jgi:hypothetical protein